MQVGSTVPEPSLPAPTPHGSPEGPRSSRLSRRLCPAARAELGGAPQPRVGAERGEAAALTASCAGIRGGNSSIPRRHPRGTRAGPWPGPRLRCGGGGPAEGETQTRTARGKQQGGTAAAWGSGRSPRPVSEPGPGLRPLVGVLAPKEKRDGAVPVALRDETAAGGTVAGSAGRFLPLPEGARGTPSPGPALRGPLPPGRATGSRSGARARAALHAPEVNGRSCLGAPRALGQGGPLAPGPPPPPPAPPRPRPCPGCPGARRGLGDGSGPARACAAAANPVSAHLTPNPPLGRRISAPPARTCAMSASGLSGPPRGRAPGSPLVSRCEGASPAASFATKPGGYCLSRGRAWGRRGEHACPSAAEPGAAAGREGAGSNPTAGTIDPRTAAGLFPAASRTLW